MNARTMVVTGLLALLIAAPADAQLFGSQKKKYDAWLASQPAEGERPSEEYVQHAVKAWMQFSLKDAESARYQFGGVELGTWRGGTERWGTPGWIATVSVNAKNSYGAYAGFTEYKFIFRSGKIVEVYSFHDRYKAWLGHIGIEGRPFSPPPLGP